MVSRVLSFCLAGLLLAGTTGAGKLKVHLVPHSHQDSGWLKTVDQYFSGARADIQVAGVAYVFDTVVQCLLDNPARTFNAAELSFFTRWWHQQTPELQTQVGD